MIFDQFEYNTVDISLVSPNLIASFMVMQVWPDLIVSGVSHSAC